MGRAIDGFFTLFGFKFRDFVTAEPNDQLDRLLQTCATFTIGSQYLFSMLNDPQRVDILSLSNEYQRFQLFRNYDLQNKALLLAGISQSEQVESLLDGQEVGLISKILQVADDDHRSAIISKMGPRLQAEWIFFLDDKKLKSSLEFLKESEKKGLAEEFTKIRVSEGYAYFDYDFITKQESFGQFLDHLAEYFSRKQALMVLSTADPIVYMSRFTPKERLALYDFMTIREKRMLLVKLQKHKLQKFPKDFFDSDIHYSYFAGSDEWKKFWEDVKFEIAQYDRRLKLGKFFRHKRSKSSDSIKTSPKSSNRNQFPAEEKHGILESTYNAVQKLSNSLGLNIPTNSRHGNNVPLTELIKNDGAVHVN